MTAASHDLESLKKRAKQLVRQHRARYFPVAQRIRAGLPAFAGMSDREVLAAPFALHDAQALLAREHGLDGWAQLKEQLMERNDEAASATAPERSEAAAEPELVRAHPQVFVTDVERALAYYRDRLGFSIRFTYGEPPFYALVERGPIGLNLRHHDEPVGDPAVRAREDLLSAMILVTEVKALFLSLDASGADFHQRLKEQPWGRDFIVRDPDGNLVAFVEDRDETRERVRRAMRLGEALR